MLSEATFPVILLFIEAVICDQRAIVPGPDEPWRKGWTPRCRCMSSSTHKFVSFRWRATFSSRTSIKNLRSSLLNRKQILAPSTVVMKTKCLKNGEHHYTHATEVNCETSIFHNAEAISQKNVIFDVFLHIWNRGALEWCKQQSWQ